MGSMFWSVFHDAGEEYHRLGYSLALSASLFGHVATATLPHRYAKITQRLAAHALTYIIKQPLIREKILTLFAYEDTPCS